MIKSEKFTFETYRDSVIGETMHYYGSNIKTTYTPFEGGVVVKCIPPKSITGRDVCVFALFSKDCIQDIEKDGYTDIQILS